MQICKGCRRLICLGVDMSVLTNLFKAATVTAVAFSLSASAKDYTKEELEQIIHSYIVEHPEVLVEASANLQKRKAEISAKNESMYLKTFEKEIFHSEADAAVGPKNAKNVIVEFSDYNCGYCKHSKKLFFKVLENHKDKGDIRYIFKEYPILGAGSEVSARASLAVYKLYPQKFLDYHMAVINSSSRISSDEDLKPFVEKLGMDWGAVSKLMSDKSISDTIEKNMNLGMAMEVTGTPCYIINGKFVRGAPQTVEYIESQLVK